MANKNKEVELKEIDARGLACPVPVLKTKAAIEEGILPGGGVALLQARKVLDTLTFGEEDEKIGIEIVRESLEMPTRWLAKNAGEDESLPLIAF